MPVVSGEKSMQILLLGRVEGGMVHSQERERWREKDGLALFLFGEIEGRG